MKQLTHIFSAGHLLLATLWQSNGIAVLNGWPCRRSTSLFCSFIYVCVFLFVIFCSFFFVYCFCKELSRDTKRLERHAINRSYFRHEGKPGANYTLQTKHKDIKRDKTYLFHHFTDFLPFFVPFVFHFCFFSLYDFCYYFALFVFTYFILFFQNMVLDSAYQATVWFWWASGLKQTQLWMGWYQHVPFRVVGSKGCVTRIGVGYCMFLQLLTGSQIFDYWFVSLAYVLRAIHKLVMKFFSNGLWMRHWQWSCWAVFYVNAFAHPTLGLMKVTDGNLTWWCLCQHSCNLFKYFEVPLWFFVLVSLGLFDVLQCYFLETSAITLNTFRRPVLSLLFQSLFQAQKAKRIQQV